MTPISSAAPAAPIALKKRGSQQLVCRFKAKKLVQYVQIKESLFRLPLRRKFVKHDEGRLFTSVGEMR